jgi:ribosome silencing factor RsfS/YbeB/iojap
LEKRIKNIFDVLNEKKALDVEVVDLTKKQYIVDYVIIATMLNNKHGFSLIEHLKNKLKPLGEEFLRVDEDDNWTVIDLGDILIHIISKSKRKEYKLEEFLEQIKSGLINESTH